MGSINRDLNVTEKALQMTPKDQKLFLWHFPPLACLLTSLLPMPLLFSRYIGDTAKPSAAKSNILVRVKAAGLNRADLLQRRGKYPPPPGDSEIMGLEVCVTNFTDLLTIPTVTNYKNGDPRLGLLRRFFYLMLRSD